MRVHGRFVRSYTDVVLFSARVYVPNLPFRACRWLRPFVFVRYGSHMITKDHAGPSRRMLTDEVAELLRMAPISVRRAASAGEFPGAYQVGRVWRFPLESVAAFEESRTHAATGIAPRTNRSEGSRRGARRRTA